MQTSSPLKTLLSQFRTHYPMGCLSSDLLTVHQGQYIVRSVAQIGGVTLATGMASAPDIEAAEDRAKARVLEALGFAVFGSIPDPIPFSSNPVSNPVVSPSGLEQPVQNGGLVAMPLKSAKEPAKEPAKEKDRFSASSDLEKNPEKNVELIPDLPPTVLAKTSVKSSDQTLNSALATPSSLTPAPEAPVSSVEPVGSVENEFGLALSSIATDEIDRFAFTAVPASSDTAFHSFDLPQPIDSTPSSGATATLSNPSPSKSDKAEKSSKRKPDTFELPPAPTSSRLPSDRSEEIMKIGIEMKRLGWSTEQGREYLKRTYGKRSRQELDDAELLDFLRYLETQSASVQTPF